MRKKAVYVAIGVTLDGERDVLGLWIEKTEGARFWTSVLTELRNRGVKDVVFVCTDGLSGFPEAIDAVFPEAVNQTCVVHLVRQSLRYLSWKERKSCAAELRRLYTAADADAARQVLDELTANWADSKTRTGALQVWDRAWERVIPFLAFPEEVRRIVYTTNTVESLHMQIRQNLMEDLLQLDERDGSPTHPLRRPHPRQHLTTHRYTEKRAGSWPGARLPSARRDRRRAPLPPRPPARPRCRARPGRARIR